MKLLHIYRTPPSEEVKKLVKLINEGEEVVGEINLWELKDDADYDRLVKLIFEADKTISWW